MLQIVQIRIGGQVDQQGIVDHGLTARTDVSATVCKCLFAGFTFTKNAGNTFRCGSTEVLKLHIVLIPFGEIRSYLIIA